MVGVARTSTIGSTAGAWAPKAPLALLLAAALLLCHGIYGASHQLHQTAGPASLHAPAHASAAGSHGGTHGDGAGHTEGGAEGHPGKTAYAAALAIVLLGAVVALLIGGVRFWVRAAAPISGRRPRLPAVARPRGSPAPVSQVFRL